MSSIAGLATDDARELGGEGSNDVWGPGPIIPAGRPRRNRTFFLVPLRKNGGLTHLAFSIIFKLYREAIAQHHGCGIRFATGPPGEVGATPE